MRRLLVCLFVAFCGIPLRAQLAPLGTVAPKARDALRAALPAGIDQAPTKPLAQSASRFQPAKRRVALEKLAAAYATEPADREQLVTLFEASIAEYEKSAKEQGMACDLAGALATLFAARALLADGKELPDGTADKIAFQLQAAMQTKAVQDLADAEKQAAFEWALGTTAMLLALQEQVAGQGGDPEHKLLAAANELLGDAFGAPGAKFVVGAAGLAPTKPAAKPAESKAPSGPSLPPPEVDVVGTPQTWHGWSFVPPAKWELQAADDGLMMKAPKQDPKAPGFTFLCLLPLQKRDGEPFAQALAILTKFFATSFSGYLDYEFDDRDVFLHRTRGTTTDGVPYALLRLRPLDQAGNRTGHQARIALFQLGDEVAPLLGFQNADEPTLENVITGKCVAWPLLLHSLAFPGRKVPDADGLREQLLGVWNIGSGTMWIREEFRKDGSFLDASAYRTYRDKDANHVEETTRSWFAEGRFHVDRNRLSVWPKGGKPRTQLFRIVEEANSQVPGGWLKQIYRLSVAVDDKVPYESRMVFGQ